MTENTRIVSETVAKVVEQASTAGTSGKQETKDGQAYLAALDQARYDGQTVWQIFGAFLLAHTVFLGFLLQAAFNNNQHVYGYKLGVFLAGLVGVLLCIPWIATYLRSYAYYFFRMNQAREKEPTGWELLQGRGQVFSKGDKVQIDGQKYQIPRLGRMLKPRRSVPLLIVVFALMYLAVTVTSGPWW